MNKIGQFDTDDINIVGIIFGLIGAGIGLIVANQMGSGLVVRLMAAVICGIACYFIGGKIAEG